MVNGVLVQLVNGVPVPIQNGQLVQLVNGQLVQLVNGQLVQLVNGQLVQLVNGVLVQMVNGQLVQLVNGQNQPVINGQLVQIVNGQLVQLVNEQYVPVANGQLVQMVNGQLVQLVNGVLVQMVNGTEIPITNGLVQIVNGQLVQLVNGQLVQMVNGTLVQLVNGQLVQLVNSYTAGSGDNEDAAVIIDTDDVAVQNGFIGAMFSANIITGLGVGQQTLISGALLNSNFSCTYGLGHITINPDTITVTADNQSRQYGEANPALTVTYSGFEFGESLQTSGITGSPVVSTTATPTSPVGTYPITVTAGTLAATNYVFKFVNGTLTVTNNACLLTHSPFKNFGNTTQLPTSLWLNLVTKVSGQLSAHGDYLLFKAGTVTFNFISSTPLVNELPMPDGKILADNTVSAPITNYDASTNTWITRVPVGYASTSDIFVTGAIINSSNGFIKLNGNTNSVVKGMFFSNRAFSDQWGYAIAAYQPQFTYSTIGGSGQVVSINGSYRAGTPLPILAYLVQGASGGGGNNYTGSGSSFENYTACISSESGRIANPEMLITQQDNATDTPTKTLLQSRVIVYPNPASRQLTITIQFAEHGNTKIELYSISGTKVLERNLGLLQKGSGNVITVDLQRLVSGTYLLRVHNGKVITNKKIVINR
jgi:hypothetical protein